MIGVMVMSITTHGDPYPDVAKLREPLRAAQRRICELEAAKAKPENRGYETYFDQEIESIRQSVAPYQEAYDQAMDAIIAESCSV